MKDRCCTKCNKLLFAPGDIACGCVANNFYLCDECEYENRHSFHRLKNFKPKEFGTHEEYICMDSYLMYMLQRVRTIIGKPFIIHAGYAVEGHSDNSYHYKGMAVDFHVKNSYFPLDVDIFTRFWTGGLGIYRKWNNPGFHVDLGPHRRWDDGEV